MAIDELHHCGEILIGVSETLKELFSSNPEDNAASSEVKAPKDKVPAKAKKPEPTPLTLEQVRAVLAEKSRQGFTQNSFLIRKAWC